MKSQKYESFRIPQATGEPEKIEIDERQRDFEDLDVS